MMHMATSNRKVMLELTLDLETGCLDEANSSISHQPDSSVMFLNTKVLTH